MRTELGEGVHGLGEQQVGVGGSVLADQPPGQVGSGPGEPVRVAEVAQGGERGSKVGLDVASPALGGVEKRTVATMLGSQIGRGLVRRRLPDDGQQAFELVEVASLQGGFERQRPGDSEAFGTHAVRIERSFGCRGRRGECGPG